MEAVRLLISNWQCCADSNLKCITLSQSRCKLSRRLPPSETRYDPAAPASMASHGSGDRSMITSGFEQVMHFNLELAL